MQDTELQEELLEDIQEIEDIQELEEVEDTEEVDQIVDIPAIGRNCRINISDKREIVRLTEELNELQRWFEQYGQNGVLFPNSIINSFEPRQRSLAA